MKSVTAVTGALALCLITTIVAQPLDRLSGKVLTEPGEPMKDVELRVEALFGFAGGEFLGQRTFATRTNARGEWALLAFKAFVLSCLRGCV